jgi:hypothetical protein
MSRPLTRTQALQNRAFLKALRRTGNVRLACREVGLKYSTMQHRRSRHRAFAVRWEAELVLAQARLAEVERKGASRSLRGTGPLPSQGCGLAHRTVGGEAVVVRLKSGGLQVRRAQPGKLTPAAEQAFLAALSATCNVSLAAAAVGSCPRAFYRRRRKDAAFAREMRMALGRGYERLEMALIESSLPGAHEHDDWRSNDPPAIPPMTADQALQLLYLHQKEARLIAEPWPIRRRRGESREAQTVRLGAMWEEQERRAREAFEVAEAERRERGEPAWGPAGEDVRGRLGPRLRGDDAQGLGLPDLSQVTGWSRTDPKKRPHHAGRALFGGWRIEEMKDQRARSD